MTERLLLPLAEVGGAGLRQVQLQTQWGCPSLADPFSVHVECDLTEEEVRDLKVTLSQPLHYQHTTVSAGSHEHNHRTSFRLVLSLPHLSTLCWALSVMLSVSLPETVASPVTSSL